MDKTKVNAVLLCGGKGARFADITEDNLPKSLYKVSGKELIRYTLDALDSEPIIDKLIFAVDHHANMMTQWIYQQNFFTEVVISRQSTPGIVGAIKSVSPYLTSSHFILCNTDEIRVGFDVNDFINKALCASKVHEGAMAVTWAQNLFRHRVIEIDNRGTIIATKLKNEKYKQSPEAQSRINIGFLMLPRSTINSFDDRYGNDWSSIIDPLVDQRRMHAVLNPSVEYFNVGTPIELAEATEFLSGAM